MSKDIPGAEVFKFPMRGRSRKKKKAEDPLQEQVRSALDEAIKWREENLEPDQVEATRAFKALPYGNEEEGRSQVVMTDVRDVVRAIKPSLLRVFFGPGDPVEFQALSPATTELAKQQTRYVRHIIREVNQGFKVFSDVCDDALIRKLGVIKAWWDDTPRVEGASYTGLTADQVAILEAEENTEVSSEVEQEEETAELAEGVEVVVRPRLFSAEVVRTVTQGQPRIAAIPPEEFVFSPDARDLDDAVLLAHVREVPLGELRAMGFDEDAIQKAAQDSEDLHENLENVRTEHRNTGEFNRSAGRDEATRLVRFADVYMRVDGDGDGTAELRHLQVVGRQAAIMTNTVVDMAPFAVFIPCPEAHTLVGNSAADLVMDLQKINTAVVRGMLDSLALSLEPNTEVVDTEVNLSDLLNRELGRVVRVRRPGMIREIETPFVGKDALPVLQWTEQVKEDRTGVSKAAMGLDADALQSATKAAVAATLSKGQEQIEMIARLFAEMGIRQLYKILNRLVIQNQDRQAVVRMQGEFVEIDPRQWNADLDIVVNVTLGNALPEDKLQALVGVLTEQKELLREGVPFVDFTVLRNTLSDITELAGLTDPNRFFAPWGPEEQAAFAEQQAETANQPDPQTQALAEVEMAKIQARSEEAAAKLQLEQQKLVFQMERMQADFQARAADLMRKVEETQSNNALEREKIVRDFVLRQAALEARFQETVSNSELQEARLVLDREVETAAAAIAGTKVRLDNSLQGE